MRVYVEWDGAQVGFRALGAVIKPHVACTLANALAEWDVTERRSDTWPGSSGAMRMTGHWVDPRKLWVWEKEAENSGVLGLEGVDRSTEAGRFWVPRTLHGHRVPNQIPRGFHEKKQKPLWGEAPAVWLQPQPVLTNTRYKSTTKSFPLASFPKPSKGCFGKYKNYGAGETVLTERGQGPALESPEPTENQTR